MSKSAFTIVCLTHDDEKSSLPWDYLPEPATLKAMSKERRAIWKRIAETIAEEKACPKFAEHNDRALGMPDGYGAREAWWRRMIKTHTQRQCDGCFRYAVWSERKR